MKKIIRLPIILILLIGVGFLYVVKNPELGISQKILTTLGITLPTSTSGTGIDLTSCVSYFDGCNTCSVKDGKVDACSLMFCETPAAPQCLEYATGTETTGAASLANPASTNCINNGGTLEIVGGTGGQIGMCTLANGTVCEERAYMRGECGIVHTGAQGPGPNINNENPSEGTVCTMEYAPVCASNQVQCIKAPCPPLEQTYSNRCTMNQNKFATFLHDGECAAK